MRWFRFYTEVVNDPKVQRLSPTLFRHWVNLLCIASEHGGVLPPCEDIAFRLRISKGQTCKVVEALAERGLFDRRGENLMPHNWAGRQYKSDVSTERVRRFRERFVKQDDGVSPTVSETPPEQNRYRIQMQNRTESVT